jgi:hypothetical protein
MLLAFFDSKGLIYLHIFPRGSTVNAAYIVKVLAQQPQEGVRRGHEKSLRRRVRHRLPAVV